MNESFLLLFFKKEESFLRSIPTLGLAYAVVASLFCAMTSAAAAAPVRNIVLVHGAWVDGSGWKPAYEILVKDGYHVSIVQEPLTSLADDVAAGVGEIAQRAGASRRCVEGLEDGGAGPAGELDARGPPGRHMGLVELLEIHGGKRTEPE